MVKDDYYKKKLLNAKLGDVVIVKGERYKVKSFMPPESKAHLCHGCDLYNNENPAGIPYCKWWKCCTGRYRPDHNSVVFQLAEKD